MSAPTNPFADLPKARAGHGTIHVANLNSQAGTPPVAVLQTLEYQYPLKLVAPGPLAIGAAISRQDRAAQATTHNLNVFTVFTLSYGGGLVAGDAINLTIYLDPCTRLNLLTQGSTKIFKSRPGNASSLGPDASVQCKAGAQPSQLTTQHLASHLAPNGTLVYLPDPVQPFAFSSFSQTQTYVLANRTTNLCVLDWATSGRSARGENWNCAFYESRNEIYASDGKGGKGRLLLRDNIRMSAPGLDGFEDIGVKERVNNWPIVGTLIVTGLLFEGLDAFFMTEFGALPRIGAPRSMLLTQSREDEDDGTGDAEGDVVEREGTARTKKWRKRRVEQEKEDGVLWTASRVRDAFLVVKFVADSVEGARCWLRGILEYEGSVVGVVGDRGLMCLR